MINKTIAIAALARDCEHALRRNIPKIEKLRLYFKSSAVVVVENDSKDGTKGVLFEWEKSAVNVKILSQDFNTQTIPAKTVECQNPGMSRARMENMCAYRNIYMDYLKQSGVDYDYLLVIDVDIDDFSVEGVIDAVQNAGWLDGAVREWGEIHFHLPPENTGKILRPLSVNTSSKKQ